MELDMTASETIHPGGVVMIVDDNPNNLQVLSGILRQAGLMVRPAISGELALSSIRNIRPDIVLLDIRMPGMDGYEVCRRLKADADTRDLPVIFISALHDVDDKVRAFQAGGVDYVVKPFQVEEIITRLHTHMDLARSRRALAEAKAMLEQRVQERTRELEESNALIRRAVREERVLGDLLNLSLRRDAVQDYLEAALDRLLEQCESTAGKRLALFLAEDGGGGHALRLAAQRGLADDQIAHCARVVQGACACARVAAERALGYFPDGEACEFASREGETRLARYCVPILSGGLTLGVMTVYDPAEVGQEEGRRRFLSRVADVLSMGIARRRADDRIEYLAYRDELTGLPNRRLFNDRLATELQHTERRQDQGAVLFLDLDRFKTINDALGHAVGDGYLRQMARRLETMLRRGDTLCRWGGDEFLILLTDLGTDPEEAAQRAGKVAAAVAAAAAKTIVVEGHELQLDASIGIALFPGDGVQVDELLSHADAALNQAKRMGRNTIRFYEGGMQSQAERALRLEKDVRRALENQEFFLHYQPQTDCSGRTIGAETLVRWRHPERGLVSPAEFIPIAEESGLIAPLGEWIMRHALGQMARWQADADPRRRLPTLSINVSSRQFHQPDFVERVRAALAETGADPGRLELEVTESMLLRDIGDTVAKMEQLRALGIRFAVDDFGTGYSSLSYLKRLPLDRLKIDQSFVRNVHQDVHDAAIVRAIVAMAGSLGLAVIAEGVETEEERRFLADIGCEAYQGYLFARPMPAEDLERYLTGGLSA